MAWRFQESVIRGEIDNRTKGIVRGSVWLHGVPEPILLELRGNACPDLAGCLLAFRNPKETVALPRDWQLRSPQRGVAGDLTASRKVRVPDVPLEEFIAWPKEKGRPPEHMGNCIHLEWFSESNGRVVIEGVEWELNISAAEWRLTPEENEQRAREAAAGMAAFMQKLTENIEKHRRGQKDPEAEWDEHDYERFLKECDARTEKYMELLDKYGDADDADEKIEEEMGWGQKDDGIERPWLDEVNDIAEEALNEPPPEPDPLREGIDWIRAEDGDLRHPLQHRCFESALKFWRIAEERGLDDLEDQDLHQFVFEFQTTGAKLAGALDGIARQEEYCDPAFTVSYLKRALHHLHKAQAGLEGVASRQLLPEATTSEARRELFEIREGILRLMDDYRGRG